MLPQFLWYSYFIEAQEYPVDQNILYQDNVATMWIEVNGSFSRSKITKHIKFNFFLYQRQGRRWLY